MGLALGIYMADVAGHLAPEDMVVTVRLLLNSLFMLANERTDYNYMKLLYDLKLLSAAGFTPETDECVNCQSEKGPFAFSALSGGVLCPSCARLSGLRPADSGALRLMSYILKSPLTKGLYKLKPEDETVAKALKMAESFIAFHIRDEIKTLDYYKKLVKML